MFTKVRQVRAFESIIQQVEHAILQGGLSTGDRLPSERELQTLLDVSRNTLRESLRVLEQKGLVEIRKGNRGGIFVKELNADAMAEGLGLFVQSQRITLEQISEFRQDLEGLVTRRAALGGSSQRLNDVDRLLEKAEELAAEGPSRWEAFMQADRDIHLALARLAGNPLHHFFLETVHTHFHRYHINAYLPRDAETIRITLAELKAIVRAVSRGETDRAEALAREHVRRATESMKQASAGAGKKAAVARPTPKNVNSKPGIPAASRSRRSQP
jgi:GntR family transcriptional regulator, transcriptional repressor for pyruvate dehydrogenase complex